VLLKPAEEHQIKINKNEITVLSRKNQLRRLEEDYKSLYNIREVILTTRRCKRNEAYSLPRTLFL
jgi:hypothetical protein